MSDFLDVADKLHRSESLGPAFDDVRQASSDLQAIHAKSKLDVDNIETLFGAIEMGRIIGQYPGRESSDIDSLRDSLVTVIVKTLERSIPFPVKDSRILPPEPYLEFGNAIRALIHDQPKHLAPTFSFITFNYDLLLDFAFNYVGLDYDYWISSDPNLDSIPMLKLHGSINWAICSVCNEIVPFMVNEAHFNLRPGMAKVYYDMGSKLSFKKHCDSALEGPPVLVPPTWDKGSYHTQISSVWKKSAEELASAEMVIIIGYSLPEADLFFRYLFALGTQSKTLIRHLLVFNPDTDGSVGERFRRLIGGGLESRTVFVNGPGGSFENAIGIISERIKKA